MIKIRPLTSALALALYGTGTLAQSAVLEEVIVTAQKRVQNLQDVPISIAAVSGEKIDDIGITGLEELTQYIPNVTINNGAGTPNLFIRGVGSGTNAGFEQSVGMYIDGVYAGRGLLASVPTTMDLERVEILKGPQGILFGKNTVAGAVNITTAKPTDEFEGMVEALYEPDHGEQQYNLVLSGPLTDSLSGRLAVRYDEMEGWWKNTITGAEGPNQQNLYARGSVLWRASDTLEIHAKYEYGDFDRGSRPTVVYQSDFEGQQNAFGSVPFPVVSDRDDGAGDVDGTSDNRTDVLAVTVDWELDFATLTSISSYSAYDYESAGNTDMAAVAALHRTKFEDYEQFSQEIRFVSPGGETIDWIAGAYYQQSEVNISQRVDAIDFALSGPLSVAGALYADEPGVPSTFDQESKSWAIFGQGTWNATETLRLSLGLRYNKETKDLDKERYADGLQIRLGNNTFLANPLNGQLIADVRQHSFTDLSRDEDKWTFSGSVQWDATDDAMLYASISTGFKGGGYDEAYSGAGYEIRLANLSGELTGESVPGNDPSVLEYEPEEVLAYEIGAKMGLLDGAAELNIALFRMEYENLQTSSLVGDVFRVGNAGESISQGVEVDGRWRVTERFTLSAAAAYLDAYYEDFTGATCTIPQTTDPDNNPGCLREDGSNITGRESGGQDLTDETLLFAPEWSATLSARYAMPLSENLLLAGNLDINYEDEFYSALDLDPNTNHDAATIINARIALSNMDRNWSVALIGKNLTDEKTYVWKNDVPITNSNSYFGLPQRPRSIAVQARYRF
ncbi:TonB-dependent receptor [Halieaceae bacterium IMCC14734]|uniref:TonB-dependent receptor n=1 Tax=Candidatus Litorirhabdus singularis TaxID=2518993 RepID=A0ABT3TL08_9GAMM|nr:TonB-dependent receptor [Candidatus Litorirhabdus singularis]MCX2982935.1 TonB-dependent receptor [Candidatus Litorirhabdus singularis]